MIANIVIFIIVNLLLILKYMLHELKLILLKYYYMIKGYILPYYKKIKFYLGKSINMVKDIFKSKQRKNI